MQKDFSQFQAFKVPMWSLKSIDTFEVQDDGLITHDP